MNLIKLPGDWQDLLGSETSKTYFHDLHQKIRQAYINGPVFPPIEQIYRAFELCSFADLKVVILGQDPYHSAGQAHGLCFSVNEGVRVPPSLKNIYKELAADIEGFKIPASGNLEHWARQGVLLLNTVLTVKASEPGSHKQMGWETFTDQVVQTISSTKHHVVFMLWGNYARTKENLIDGNKHLILKAAHPSPLARGGFFGCKHFSEANRYLRAQGQRPICW